LYRLRRAMASRARSIMRPGLPASARGRSEARDRRTCLLAGGLAPARRSRGPVERRARPSPRGTSVERQRIAAGEGCRTQALRRTRGVQAFSEPSLSVISANLEPCVRPREPIVSLQHPIDPLQRRIDPLQGRHPVIAGKNRIDAPSRAHIARSHRACATKDRRRSSLHTPDATLQRVNATSHRHDGRREYARCNEGERHCGIASGQRSIEDARCSDAFAQSRVAFAQSRVALGQCDVPQRSAASVESADKNHRSSLRPGRSSRASCPRRPCWFATRRSPRRAPRTGASRSR